ncbi:hypothetical protein E2C01_002168 [Portunus trituberculatus]|uniref:Uncharacterized protein n=1 Tax=Portunus trituberculatus TaxID=210409 RepID=A0A5B7CPT9_PORTR|nr:hypothetical protein [Portunus trituberculatus]
MMNTSGQYLCDLWNSFVEKRIRNNVWLDRDSRLAPVGHARLYHNSQLCLTCRDPSSKPLPCCLRIVAYCGFFM